MFSKINKHWLFYGLISMIFLLLPVLSSPDLSLDLHFIHVKPFQRTLISYVLLLLFFYVQMFFFLPKLYFRQKYLAFWLCMIGSFIICAALPLLLIPHQMHPPHLHHDPMRPHFSVASRLVFSITQYLFQFLVVGIFSFSVQINAHLKQSERARIDAELAYLKAQINPHFLFNTLNSIYSLAIQKSDNTAEAVVQLSSMMRYVLSEASKDHVPLQKEVDYISDYIALQKTRLSDNVNFTYEIVGAPYGQQIAPMLLIPFVENAFKYGVNPDENCTIVIRFVITEKTLLLHTFNKKVKLREVHSESNKMGIENTRKRLSSLYPAQHELKVSEDDHSFTVSLSITLK